MIKLRNILVPIDFSTCSNQSFEIGHCLAKHNGAKLHLIHVIDSDYYNNQRSHASKRESVQQSRLGNAKEELDKFKFEIPHSDVEITEAIIEGVPHKEILHYARQKDIDLIIIASHGWTNLPHMLMGKCAEKIMRLADVPVICLKSNLPVI